MIIIENNQKISANSKRIIQISTQKIKTANEIKLVILGLAFSFLIFIRMITMITLINIK